MKHTSQQSRHTLWIVPILALLVSGLLACTSPPSPETMSVKNPIVAETPTEPSPPTTTSTALPAAPIPTSAPESSPATATPIPTQTPPPPASTAGDVPTTIPTALPANTPQPAVTPIPEPTSTPEPASTPAQSPAPAPTPTPVLDSPFGAELNRPLGDQSLDLLKSAGIHWIRRNGVAWHKVEPEPGQRNWNKLARFDAELKLAHENGLTPIIIVRGTPAWAQKVSGSFCGPIAEHAFDDFADFMVALVERYKDAPYHVKYWELGNEPDAGFYEGDRVYGCWGDKNAPYYGGGYYGEMLKVVYPAIKSADPEARVVIGGLLLDKHPDHPAAGPNAPARFLVGVLVAGAGDYFDIVSFHGYPHYTKQLEDWEFTSLDNWRDWGGVVAGKAEYVRQVLATHGYEKPLMFTEGGLICHPLVCSPEPTEQFWHDQADYLPRLYTRNIAIGIEVTFWYSLEGPGWRWGSLLRRDLSPKPAYIAYHTLTSELEGSTYVREIVEADYDPEIQGYVFARADRTVHVIWGTDAQVRPVQVDASKIIRVLNKYGEPVALTSKEDQTWLNVGFSPLYVEWSSSS